MQRFRVECNFGSKYFDDIFNARRYFYKCIESDLQVELWKVTYHLCAEKKRIFGNARVNGVLRIFAFFEVRIILER